MAVMRRSKYWVALVAFGLGTLFQFMPTGCTQYYTAAALSAFDFCSVLNCEGSTYFDLCGTFPLLVDCPEFQQETTP